MADKRTEIRLMRLLTGELSASAEAELRRRIEVDQDLRSAYERLEASWSALRLPEPLPAPVGFPSRVVARAAKVFASRTSTPIWARVAAASVLAAGVLVGVQLVDLIGDDDWESYLTADTTLAESYWLVAGDSGEGQDSAAGEEAP